MGSGQLRTTADWERLKSVNLKLWGKETSLGGYYKRWLKIYEEQLAEAESWLKTNPANTSYQAAVARLRKKVEECRESEARLP